MTALTNGDASTAKTNETNASNDKTAALKKIDSTYSESLDYLQKKAKVDAEQAKYDAAKLALDTVNDKIKRIEDIMKHMKDGGNNDAGTIKDI